MIADFFPRQVAILVRDGLSCPGYYLPPYPSIESPPKIVEWKVGDKEKGKKWGRGSKRKECGTKSEKGKKGKAHVAQITNLYSLLQNHYSYHIHLRRPDPSTAPQTLGWQTRQDCAGHSATHRNLRSLGFLCATAAVAAVLVAVAVVAVAVAGAAAWWPVRARTGYCSPRRALAVVAVAVAEGGAEAVGC